MAYYVYMLRCSDETLYIGSTNDIDKRLRAHNELKTGARYTRSRRPVLLVYIEEFKKKNDALKRECALKKFTRKGKLALIS